MLIAFRANWPLLVGVLLLMISNGMLVTLLSIRGEALGFSATTIGVMQAFYPLGALFGCVVTPRLVERVGHIRAFGALASLCSVASVVHLLTDDPYTWSAMRALAGFCFPGLYVVSESWLNAKANNRTRASLLSLYFIAQTGGSAIGPALIGLPDPSGDLLFGLASILISLALVPVLTSAGAAPAFEAPERMSLIRLMRRTPLGALGAMLNGVAQAAFYVSAPLYALAIGFEESQVGAVITVAILGGVALQYPIGRLSDRIDRRLVIAGASAFAGGMSLLILTGPAGLAFVVLLTLMAAAMVPIYAICVAHANDHLAPSQTIAASGALVMSLNIGLLAGSFGGPAAIGALGPVGLFVFLACAQFALVALAVARRLTGPAVAAKTEAQAMSPHATAGAAELARPD